MKKIILTLTGLFLVGCGSSYPTYTKSHEELFHPKTCMELGCDLDDDSVDWCINHMEDNLDSTRICEYYKNCGCY